MPDGRPYRIFETTSFQASLGSIQPLELRSRISGRLRGIVYPRLAAHPQHGPNIRKLAGFKPPTWRYRLGGWRIFYTVSDSEHVVSLLSIGPRKDAY